jgi:hypothetical protein
LVEVELVHGAYGQQLEQLEAAERHAHVVLRALHWDQGLGVLLLEELDLCKGLGTSSVSRIGQMLRNSSFRFVGDSRRIRIRSIKNIRF